MSKETENKEVKFTPPHDHVISFANARRKILEAGVHARGENPAYKKDGKPSKYLTINDIILAVEPALLENNLVATFTQSLGHQAVDSEWKPYAVFFKLTIMHYPSLNKFESVCMMYSKPDAQSMGKAMTYAKRYLYQNLLMLPTVTDKEDDDAQSITEDMQKLQPKKLDRLGG